MSLILLSGGIDSAVAGALANSTASLFVDYGHPAADHEYLAAVEMAGTLRIPLEVANADLPNIGQGDSHVYPGRNAALLALGAALANDMHLGEVVIGCNADDAQDYPDCRPSFLRAMDEVTSTYGVSVNAPLVGMSKREIIQEARKLRIPIDHAYTCYMGADGGCGRCAACVRLAEAIG